MNIFVDESGSFVSAPTRGSFNSIVAYVSPDQDSAGLDELVSSLRDEDSPPSSCETKLGNLSEPQYLDFLDHLARLNGALFAVATDSGLNNLALVREHQGLQAQRIVLHKDRALHQTLRDELVTLSDRIACLSPQLYVQFCCQVSLIEATVRRGVLFYVQRIPGCLGTFRWRYDRKNSLQTEFERAFTQVLPAFLQNRFLREPMMELEGADYSVFSRFYWTQEERPTYLRREYGMEIGDDEKATNIGLLLREDVEFVDSKVNPGVQVADLLASGIRRSLRSGFDDNDLVAAKLGKLMVQNRSGRLPVEILSFSLLEVPVEPHEDRVLQIMGNNARSMLVH